MRGFDHLYLSFFFCFASFFLAFFLFLSLFSFLSLFLSVYILSSFPSFSLCLSSCFPRPALLGGSGAEAFLTFEGVGSAVMCCFSRCVASQFRFVRRCKGWEASMRRPPQVLGVTWSARGDAARTTPSPRAGDSTGSSPFVVICKF